MAIQTKKKTAEIVHQAAQTTAMAIPDALANVMPMLSGIENVDPSGSRQYFPGGFEGVVRVTKADMIRSQKGTAFVLTVDVHNSNDEDAVQPGQTYSIYQGMDKYPELGRAFLVAFVIASLGISTVDKADAENLAQAKRGMKAHIQNLFQRDLEEEPLYVVVKTKSKATKAGGEFTEHFFRPVQEDDAPELFAEG